MEKYGRDIKIRIEILTQDNKKYIENFYCGNPSIDEYFQKQSVKDRASVTYLYIDEEVDAIVACMTIVCSAIFTENDCDKQFSTILSAMEIKYLATSEEYQHLPYSPEKEKLSLSDVMFDYMISYMFDLSHTKIGAAKIVLYSVPQAINFYKRHGFRKFGSTMYGDEGYYVDNCEPMYLDLNS